MLSRMRLLLSGTAVNLKNAAVYTHDVLNQVPYLENFNMYDALPRLKESIAAYGAAGQYGEQLAVFGKECGSEYWLNQAHTANKNEPAFAPFDRQGRRIDQAAFHESYHRLMGLALKSGMAGLPSKDRAHGHVAGSALSYLFFGTEQGVSCPVTMTTACVPALELGGPFFQPWIEKMTTSDYDSRDIHISMKRAATCGMSMTEKQGGSDVRLNTTIAHALDAARASENGCPYRITGHKWFTSAPMSDSFLTLAYTAEKKLSCFLIPRWISPTERNHGLRFQRLKNKMGDKSNASSEVEYHDAVGYLLGNPGEGVKTIIKMVNHTRLLCMVGSASLMSNALLHAVNHATHRSAFGGSLVSKPVMQNVLCDLALECEGVTALAMRVAASFDEGSGLSKDYMRIAVAVGKYTVCKRAPSVTYECMECMGGNGYLEDFPLARFFRQSPLNAIWEGSGNVIVLDTFRAMGTSPKTLDAIVAEVQTTGNPILTREMDDIYATLKSTPLADLEYCGRRLVERLGSLLQAAALYHSKGDMSVYESFVATRIGEHKGMRPVQFGTLDAKHVRMDLIQRHTPQLLFDQRIE